MTKPRIEIDKEAVRFIHEGGQTNLFWSDLFNPPPRMSGGFQHEVMANLKHLYEECIRLNVEPEIEADQPLPGEDASEEKSTAVDDPWSFSWCHQRIADLEAKVEALEAELEEE